MPTTKVGTLSHLQLRLITFSPAACTFFLLVSPQHLKHRLPRRQRLLQLPTNRIFSSSDLIIAVFRPIHLSQTAANAAHDLITQCKPFFLYSIGIIVGNVAAHFLKFCRSIFLLLCQFRIALVKPQQLI